MILRIPNPAHRALIVAAALFLAVFLSYFSIRNARAVYFAGLQTAEGYARAVQLEPADARNSYLLGRYWQYNLDDPNSQRAIRAYLSSLSFNPRSADTWMDLATAYESEGDLASARDAFLHAKKAYPLSAEVSWRYGNFLLRQGELDPAFAELRNAVQADPKRGAEAFSRALRIEPGVQKILDRVLPPIGDVYVDVIRDQISDGQTDIALRVWDRLVAIHPRLPLRDAFFLVGALMNSNRIPDAHRVWDQAVAFAGMADLQGPHGSVLWDGGFESGVTGGGFSWLFPGNPPDVQFGLDAHEKHSGNYSLRLIFDGKSNLNLNDFCHFVPVQPSTSYRFSAWLRTRALTTDQGLRFQLRSVGSQDSSSSVTPDVRGTEPWTLVETTWSSGIGVQEAQVCMVRFPSEQADNNIEGTVWVDDVALVPQSPERSRP